MNDDFQQSIRSNPEFVGRRLVDSAESRSFPAGLRGSNPRDDQRFGSIGEDSTRSLREQVEFNEARWHYIRDLRENNCGYVSDALSPEEHKAYARLEVSSGEDPEVMKLLIAGYEALKTAGVSLKSGNCRPSPPTLESIRAGIEGADQGARDYHDRASTADRLGRGESVRSDHMNTRERDFFDGREWA